MMDRRAPAQRRLALLSLFGAAVLAVVACGDSDSSASAPVSPEATPDAAATPAGGDQSPDLGTAELSAPANVRLEGELPDLDEPVPEGSGELGRVTVRWDAVPGAEGYRIYLQGCDGEVECAHIEVGGDERSYGPVQACRPGGNVGVAAYEGDRDSDIVWAQ